MKNVIISADGDRMVYSVPNIVADNLTEYCIEFCHRWLRTSSHAKKYRINGGLCYNERDFIEYLNRFIVNLYCAIAFRFRSFPFRRRSRFAMRKGQGV